MTVRGLASRGAFRRHNQLGEAVASEAGFRQYASARCVGRAIRRSPGPLQSELPRPGMVLATTPSLESHEVKRYLGVVCGEAILGSNVFRDVFASITDIVGGRSHAYESALTDARQIALAEMAHRAKDLGANSVLSIDVDYETIRGSMLMVTCSGTAVEVNGPQTTPDITQRGAT